MWLKGLPYLLLSHPYANKYFYLIVIFEALMNYDSLYLKTPKTLCFILNTLYLQMVESIVWLS